MHSGSSTVCNYTEKALVFQIRTLSVLLKRECDIFLGQMLERSQLLFFFEKSQVYLRLKPPLFPVYTVSRAKTIYHAIAGSGAKISVNFMDVGLFFHIVFPLWYMGIFHLLSFVHGSIPRGFQWLHEQFPWKYLYGFDCIQILQILGSQVQIPNRTKTICKVRRLNALYKYLPFKRLKLKPISKRWEKISNRL